MDPVVGPVDGDERLAEIAQGGFARGSDVLLGHHDPYRPPIRVDHLAVADLVLHPAEGMDAEGVVADAQFRLLGHLDLGDQAARRRIPPGELDAGCLADQAASSVAPDEILRPQRLAVGQLDVDAGVVLREARHLTSAVDRHRQLADPAGQDALDVVLPQPEPVGVPGGEVADVQRGPGELPRPEPPVPPRGTDRRFHADRGPRWCVSADRRRASRRGPGSARRSTIATSTPANANSPASISPVGPPPAITTACSVMATLQSDTSTTTHAFRPPIERDGERRTPAPLATPDSWSCRTAWVRLPLCPSGSGQPTGPPSLRRSASW